MKHNASIISDSDRPSRTIFRAVGSVRIQGHSYFTFYTHFVLFLNTELEVITSDYYNQG